MGLVKVVVVIGRLKVDNILENNNDAISVFRLRLQGDKQNGQLQAAKHRPDATVIFFLKQPSFQSLQSIMADFKLSAEDLKNDPESMFQMMDKLGEGSYGAVYKAMHKASSTLVALKIVPVDNDLDDILKEISVMTGLQCSAIVQFYGNFIKNDHLWVCLLLLHLERGILISALL